MIKGILFDYDGTLSNRVESSYRKYKDVLKQLFPDVDPKSIEFEGIVQRCMTWDEYGTINKRHVYTQLKNTYNLDLDVEAWVKEWYGNFHEYQVLQKDCKRILKELGEKYKLGCVTNGNSFTQNLKIDEMGLRSYFKTIIVSGDVGINKPDERIFLMAAKNLGLKPNEIAFIGDTFSTDIVGAARAGMKPIWYFNDPLRISDSKVKRIHDFVELEDLFLKKK